MERRNRGCKGGRLEKSSAALPGAAGHAYGCNDIWQWYDETREPRSYASIPWQNALHLPGAFQMGMVGELFESRPWQKLRPDQGLVVAGQGQGEDHIQAACAEDGSFLFAYLTFGNPITVDITRIAGAPVRAHWFDPRRGTWSAIGEYPNTGKQEFVPPHSGGVWDWVLVLDEAVKAYPASDHVWEGAPALSRLFAKRQREHCGNACAQTNADGVGSAGRKEHR